MTTHESDPQITVQMIEDSARGLAGKNGQKNFMRTTGDTMRVRTNRSLRRFGGRETNVTVVDPQVDTPHVGPVHPAHRLSIITFPVVRSFSPRIKETHAILAQVVGGEFILLNNPSHKSKGSENVETESGHYPNISGYYEILNEETLMEEPLSNEKKDIRRRRKESVRSFLHEASRLTQIGTRKLKQPKSIFAAAGRVGASFNYVAHFARGEKEAIVTETNRKPDTTYKIKHRSTKEDIWKLYQLNFTNRKVLVEVQLPEQKDREFRLATSFEFEQLMRDISSFGIDDLR